MGLVRSLVKPLSWCTPSYEAALDLLGESFSVSRILGKVLGLAYSAAASVVGDGVSLVAGIAYRDDELEYAGTSLDVPGYSQIESYTCGFMAGLTVLHAFDPFADSTDFFYTVNPCRIMGTETGELVAALEEWDVAVEEHDDLSIEDICSRIDEGCPVITTLSVYSWLEHWVVIYGHDGDDLLITNNRQNRLTRGEFRQQWAERGFGLVCWGGEE